MVFMMHRPHLGLSTRSSPPRTAFWPENHPSIQWHLPTGAPHCLMWFPPSLSRSAQRAWARASSRPPGYARSPEEGPQGVWGTGKGGARHRVSWAGGTVLGSRTDLMTPSF